MTARIVIDPGGDPQPGSRTFADSFVGGLFKLSNSDDTDVLGWKWEWIDTPEFSPTLNPLPGPSFDATLNVTPDVVGWSIMIRLSTYSDALRTVLDGVDEVVLGIKFPTPLDWCIPAATERRHKDAQRGWSAAVNRMLADAHAAAVAGGGSGGRSDVRWDGSSNPDGTYSGSPVNQYSVDFAAAAGGLYLWNAPPESPITATLPAPDPSLHNEEVWFFGVLNPGALVVDGNGTSIYAFGLGVLGDSTMALGGYSLHGFRYEASIPVWIEVHGAGALGSAELAQVLGPPTFAQVQSALASADSPVDLNGQALTNADLSQLSFAFLKVKPFYNTSSDDDGNYTGSNTINAGAFNAEWDRINLWQVGATATLPSPTSADHNRMVAFYEVGGVGGALVVNAAGGKTINVNALHAVGSATFHSGQSFVLLRYEHEFGYWNVVDGAIWHALALDTAHTNNRLLGTNVNGNLASVRADDGTLVGTPRTEYGAGIQALNYAGLRNVLEDPTGIIAATLGGTSNGYAPVSSAAWRTCWCAAITSTGSTVRGFAVSNALDFVRCKLLVCTAASVDTLTLVHEGGAASASERILTSNGADFIMQPGQSCWLVYDTTGNIGGTANRWVVFDPITAASLSNGLFVSRSGSRAFAAMTSDFDVLMAGSFVGGGIGPYDLANANQHTGAAYGTNAHGSAVTQGQALYASASSFSVDLAKADALATAQFLGALTDPTASNNASVNDGAAALVQFAGKHPKIPAALQGGGSWAVNDRIYLSAATAGAYTNVPPSTSGQYVVPVGRCLNTPAGGNAVMLVEKGTILEIA